MTVSDNNQEKDAQYDKTSTHVEEQTVEPLPETADRESYHQSRNLQLQPFSSWDALLTSYRLFSQHIGVLLLFALLTAIPNGIANVALYMLVPELAEIQNSSSENQTIEEVFKECQAISQSIPPSTLITITGINLLASLLTAFLTIGGIRLFNAYGRNQKARFGLIFSGFDSPGRVLLMFLIMFILSFAFSMAAMFILLAIAMMGLIQIGIFLLLCLMILFMAYLFFVLPLIADSNIPTVKAFHLSYIIARRNVITLFGTISLLLFVMLFINVFVLGLFGSFLSTALVSLIAQVLFEPLFVGVISVAYLKATGQFRQ